MSSSNKSMNIRIVEVINLYNSSLLEFITETSIYAKIKLINSNYKARTELQEYSDHPIFGSSFNIPLPKDIDYKVPLICKIKIMQQGFFKDNCIAKLKINLVDYLYSKESEYYLELLAQLIIAYLYTYNIIKYSFSYSNC